MKNEEKKIKTESQKYVILDPYTGEEVQTGHTLEYWRAKFFQYQFEYRKAEADLAAKGKTMAQGPITNFDDFVIAAMNATKEEKDKGTKQSSVAAIVREQKFEFSRKTAIGIQKLYEEKTGEKLSLEDIRTEHDPEKKKVFYDLLKDLYRELKDEGLSSAAAGKFISQTFFGSK